MFARAFTWRLSSAACRPFADARANALAAASRNRSRLKQSRRLLGIDPPDVPAAEQISCSDPEQQTALKEIFAALRTRDWEAGVAAYGRFSDPEPNLALAAVILAERCGKTTEAFDLYVDLRRRKELTARVFTHLIRLAGKVHTVLAQAMLAEMKVCKLQPNQQNYLALLELFKQRRDAKAARETWQQMRQDIGEASEMTLCSVMSAVAKSGDVAGTEALLLEGNKIGRPHFNCCLDACHVAGDADNAFRILGEMKAAGCPPDVISYNSVLGALDKAGRPSADRVRLLEDMERSGVKPNNLFLERHIACILGIPQKGAAVREVLQLPSEVRVEALETIRKAEADGVEPTLLTQKVTKQVIETEHLAKENDWVKVVGKDGAGSPLEYYWDRSSGLTQWEHPDCQVMETVSA
ncbi:unnamed protein product [Effrenium voratum]|nr:unnamed protein product [Effrenium voratum]